MLIQTFQENPQAYAIIVMSVMISIVLHELAHGYAAIMLGDRTPIEQGRMTGNPLVHMGLFSIAILFIVGIAWGQMPIDPTRLRGKRGEAIVAFAGPASNLILALLCLSGYAFWVRNFGYAEDDFPSLMQDLLVTMGWMNIALCLFNLIPLPPLDGAHILANFHQGYAQLVNDPQHQQAFRFGFIIVFLIAPKIFDLGKELAVQYISLLL